jgi:hypothetical protein
MADCGAFALCLNLIAQVRTVLRLTVHNTSVSNTLVVLIYRLNSSVQVALDGIIVDWLQDIHSRGVPECLAYSPSATKVASPLVITVLSTPFTIRPTSSLRSSPRSCRPSSLTSTCTSAVMKSISAVGQCLFSLRLKL